MSNPRKAWQWGMQKSYNWSPLAADWTDRLNSFCRLIIRRNAYEWLDGQDVVRTDRFARLAARRLIT